jgi:ribosome-associated heat shock protein Hsp15
MRIDKYLWAVRLFKTRSIATEAVKAGKVKMGGQEIKASREVKPGDLLEVKQNPIWRQYRVIALLPNRVAGKLVPEYLEDLTPAEELEKLAIMREAQAANRPRGAGRPTKRERRELDRFTDDWP